MTDVSLLLHMCHSFCNKVRWRRIVRCRWTMEETVVAAFVAAGQQGRQRHRSANPSLCLVVELLRLYHLCITTGPAIRSLRSEACDPNPSIRGLRSDRGLRTEACHLRPANRGLPSEAFDPRPAIRSLRSEAFDLRPSI